MSSQPVSLRMVLVGASRPDEMLWRQAVAMVSVPIELTTHQATTAVNTLIKGGVVDICVLDAALSDADKAIAFNAANRAQPAPLVFILALVGSAHIDGTLTKPASVADARKMAEIWIHTRIKTRVLIVDDSAVMRKIVSKTLSSTRFALDIHEVAEGLAAINQLRVGNYDIVFLDYNMPGLNGLETLSMIKRDYPNVAVVIITSTVDNSVADRAHSLGALAFLKKPFYPADIQDILDRYYKLDVFHI